MIFDFSLGLGQKVWVEAWMGLDSGVETVQGELLGLAAEDSEEAENQEPG